MPRHSISLLVAFSALGLLGATGCARASHRAPELGARALIERADTTRLLGELLAVHRDSLAQLVDDSVRWTAIADVRRATIDRSTTSARDVLVRHTLFGVATGAAMTLACTSYDGDGRSCFGSVFPVMLAPSLVIGFIAALDAANRRYPEFVRPTVEILRPWARYPQGMPSGTADGPRHPCERAASRTIGRSSYRWPVVRAMITRTVDTRPFFLWELRDA